MFQRNDLVTTRGERAHVGVVVCTHERGYLGVYDLTAGKPKRWAIKDVRAGGTVPTPIPEPDPTPVPPGPVPVPPEPPVPTPAPTTDLALELVIPGDWPQRVVPAMSTFAPAYVRLDMGRVPRDGWPMTFGPIRRAGARVIAMAPRGMSPGSVATYAKAWLREGDVIEGENETGYVDRTQTFAAGRDYGVRMKALRAGLDSANVTLKLIVQADPAIRGTGFIDGLYAAWPDVHRHPGFGGFVVHPYGPPTATSLMDGYRNRLAEQHRQLVAHGAPENVPIWITEWGVSTRDGKPISAKDGNYGWPLTITYEQAAAANEQAAAEFDERPENVVVMVLFQAINQAELNDVRDGRELYFGELLRDGSARGVLTTRVAALFKRYRGRS